MHGYSSSPAAREERERNRLPAIALRGATLDEIRGNFARVVLLVAAAIGKR
jgi:hypothetical protein